MFCILARRYSGVLVLGALAAATPVQSSPPGQGHGFHMPMPDQELYVRCRFEEQGEVQNVETALAVPSLMAPAELDQELILPPPRGALRLRQYLPQALREQDIEVVGEGEGKPAVRLLIAGPRQSFERWLVAGDEERNRLSSLIGTWRYMAVADRAQRDELFKQFERERDRAPKILVARRDGQDAGAMPAQSGATRTFEKLNCKITVRRFYPHFGLDKKTKEPVNQSQKRLNPAALVHIEYEGKQSQQWVFGKFPGFQAESEEGMPYRIRLDCPVEAQNPLPDFVIVTVKPDAHEVWTRHEGNVTAQSTSADLPTSVARTNYSFRLTKFVPAGRLVEKYRPTDQRAAATVLRVDVATAPGVYAPVWVELGKSRMVHTDRGKISITFASRPAGTSGGERWSH